MTIPEFKKIANKLKKLYSELELQAQEEGISTASKEWDLIQEKARANILKANGFTIEEYRTAKEEYLASREIKENKPPTDISQVLDRVSQLKGETGNKGIDGKDAHTPTNEELLALIIPLIPEPINGKTPTKEEILSLIKPLIPKVKDGETPSDKKLLALIETLIPNYDADLGYLEDLIKQIKKEIPEPLNEEKLVEKILQRADVSFKKNIDMMGMPDFRKLAIGLNERIDNLSSGVTDHGLLTGLTDDDHTQYALLAGRAGGQILIGGIAASENLTLQSTSHATRGKILFGTSAYDEVNNRLGIGTDSPAQSLDIQTGDIYLTSDSNEQLRFRAVGGTFLGAILMNQGVANSLQLFASGDGATPVMTLRSGKVGINSVSNPTAYLELPTGTAAATTAPLKFASGTLLTTAEAGSVEFLTDKFYGTITTGAARKELTLNDAALTATRIPFATTNGRLTDSANLTFISGDYQIFLGGEALEGILSGPSATTAATNGGSFLILGGD